MSLLYASFHSAEWVGRKVRHRTTVTTAVECQCPAPQVSRCQAMFARYSVRITNGDAKAARTKTFWQFVCWHCKKALDINQPLLSRLDKGEVRMPGSSNGYMRYGPELDTSTYAIMVVVVCERASFRVLWTNTTWTS